MLENARNQSTMVRLLAGVSRRLEAAARRSRVATVGRTLRRYVTASWCYRWLTSEPDPDVIVIDLRETKTVGPIIARIDRLLASLQRGLPSSTAANGAAAVAAFVRDRPVVAGSLFVLPATAASFGSFALGGALTTPLLLGHLFVAGLAALGLRSDHDLEDLRETKTAQVLAAAFEPPEPPAPQAPQESREPHQQSASRHQPSTDADVSTSVDDERSLEEPAAADGPESTDRDE